MMSISTSGAPGETRTPNLRIRSAALYPLSYGGTGRYYKPNLPVLVARLLSARSWKLV